MKEIDDWIEETYLKFAEQENKDPRRSLDDFLQRYIFSNIYEIFLGSIHIELPRVQVINFATEKCGNIHRKAWILPHLSVFFSVETIPSQ